MANNTKTNLQSEFHTSCFFNALHNFSIDSKSKDIYKNKKT